MKLSTKVAYNTIIQIVSKIIITGLGLVAAAILMRYLGQEDFGKYTTITTFLSLFGVAADLGLTLVTTQMISQPGIDQHKALNNLFGLRFFSSLLFLSLAPLVIIFLPYGIEVKIGVAVAALAFFFISLNQIFVGLFQNKLRMDKVSIAEIIGRAALVLGVFLVAYYNFGLMGALISMIIANGLSFFFHYWFARRFFKVRIGMSLLWWREILKKSWPLALTVVFNLIYLRGDILVLSLVRDQSEVGVYGATYKVVDVLVMIPFVLGGIILPLLTSGWAKKQYDHFQKIIQRAVNFMIILSIPLIVGAQFLSTQIMTLIAGSEFADSGPILQILVLACAAIFIGVIFSHVIIAIDKQKKIIWAYVFTSITSLIGYVIFIPKYSYIGAAWMTVYSEVLIGAFAIYYTWKFASFVPELRIILKSFLAAGVMGVVLYFIPVSFYESFLGLMTTLTGAGLVYFLSLYGLKGITHQEFRILLNK